MVGILRESNLVGHPTYGLPAYFPFQSQPQLTTEYDRYILDFTMLGNRDSHNNNLSGSHWVHSVYSLPQLWKKSQMK